ncbi:uncharacterized protein LOC128186905 isoform X1 [Crassostrea angulata]|uniref:uncharacterized protein LOC128186905 isoform X1 n=2 Tax=Magallana angulata TaxID=2784310 RepID=UPI0009751CA8|nr:uncharacterized protein LOC128186905 isoform X1 [Crassostrea angulata]|eukprot:XP_019924486.1 PREDICTED: uncharacterized protein LOC109619244 [Crassostrea gigas]
MKMSVYTYCVSSKARDIVLFLELTFLGFQKVTCNDSPSNGTVNDKTPGNMSSYQNISTESTTDNNSSTSTASQTTSTEEPPEDIIDIIQPYVIVGGVAVLLLLLIVNFVSVVQRRKNHRALQGYLLSLHTLVPLLRNYDDIPDRPYGGGRKMSKQQVIEEYDEIGLCKRLSEIRNSKKTEDRNTVYSLQKEIFSSNL